MAVTVAQTGTVAEGNLFAGTDTYIYTGLGAATVGNRIVFMMMGIATNRTITSVTDTLGSTTFTAVANAADNNASGKTFIYEGIAAGIAPGDTITVVVSGAHSTNCGIVAVECAGMSNTVANSVGANAGGLNDATTTHNSGSVDPPSADNIIFYNMVHTSGSYTLDSAFTNIDFTGNFECGYLIQSTDTAQESNVTSTVNEDSTMGIAALEGAASGSALDIDTAAVATFSGSSSASGASSITATAAATFTGSSTATGAFGLSATSVAMFTGAAAASGAVNPQSVSDATWNGISTATGAVSAQATGAVEWVGESVAANSGDFSITATSDVQFVGQSTNSGAAQIIALSELEFVGSSGDTDNTDSLEAWKYIQRSLPQERKRKKLEQQNEEFLRMCEMALPHLVAESIKSTKH